MPIVRTARLHRFLAALDDPARGPIAASDVGIVVAHPDDETIACGALLRRLRGVRLIIVTDGAPQNLHDALAHGFVGAEAYAEARSAELLGVAAALGIEDERVIQLRIPDQETVFHLEKITAELAQIVRMRGIALMLTLAYEGGHPDHDSTALAVHCAASRTASPMAIVEMPLYRAGKVHDLKQSFAEMPGTNPVVVPLTNEERAFKRKLVERYRTQAHVLAGFSLETERFRIAPDHDFTKPPNGGRVLYERENWGIAPEQWLTYARKTLVAEAVP